ncbi:8-oxo-dGTP pyrophosphatase MutT (NUDIX family) [Virgibacillus natechei]|uniref:8-oxo-dGTP pyrophosphatase MutT (NUDIX family) n=1 Tax=Virgibacillus natechei TaxID=1216297 RepID=A0ABS4IIJ8_9BACI|nr:CoA pyrophosphatase [Virgibacillus natechei]MBP1970256.1 8-oxo-dGTP pyrophosphatase MutT (NUDIX family) [Virgibacillus natechei]UZD12799.1 CoA pyrophosphatase [Virgibacillus natechei]
MNLSSITKKLQNRSPSILGQDELQKSAILLPLIQVDNETHILFEVRSMKMRRQPGDICFPGGKIDKADKTPKHAAIRETTEELGIDESAIGDVIPLDYIVHDAGRMIYPFIGTLKNVEKITPSEAEVEEIFTVPLDYFLRTKPDIHKVDIKIEPDKDFPFDLIVGGKNYNWHARQIDEIFYKYDGKVIWGLTAKILRHFLSLLDKDNNDIK